MKTKFQKELDDLVKMPPGPKWETTFRNIGNRLHTAWARGEFTLEEIKTMLLKARARGAKK